MAKEPIILRKDQLEKQLDFPKILEALEKGFVMYSQKKVVVPPVGSLHFENPPGDVHIKYGHVIDADHYVIKIASGFYDNPKLGISSSQGLMLIFSSKTGELESILLDEGLLTNVRTALAGAIAAKYLAPKEVEHIGIVGTGLQAKAQLEALSFVSNCKSAYIWGRSSQNLEAYAQKITGFDLHLTQDIEELAKKCRLIVTTTPSTNPLLLKDMTQPGTHITAMGADGSGKNELDPKIFEKADIIAVDSKDQCFLYGDTSFALKEKCLQESDVVELGEVIDNPKLRRENEQQITIADLTGVAVQDIMIATLMGLP